MSDNQLRIEILKQVENGELDLEKAAALLAALDKNIPLTPETSTKQEEEIEHIIINEPPLKSEEIKKPGWAAVFWVLPLLLGGIVTAFSATWLYQGYTEAGLGWRFWLSWIPFLIGVFLIYLGWVLQSARWISIFIRQPAGEKPEKIVLGFPIPIKLTTWVFRIFRHRMPEKISSIDVESMVDALDHELVKGEPLYVHVDDEDGTKVEIYIG